MAAIDFPSSPSNGDTHTVGGVTYTYNSAETKWKTTINSNAFLPLTGGTVSGNIALDELHHRGDVDTNITFGTDEIQFDTAGSERFRVGSAGQLGIGGATYGTSGQVLTSGGASAAPTWGSAGKILQVLQAVKTDTQSNSNDTSWTDITDLSVNITPASSSSKFLLMATIAHSFYGSYNASHFRFAKGGSAISGALGDASANANVLQASFTGSAMNSPNEYNQVTDSMNYLDSPSATSQITYNVQWRVSYAPASYTNYINQNYQETNDDSRSRTISSLTVIEVAG